MFTRLLVPIDGSDHAKKALDCALELADQFDASVEILHVVPTIPITPLTYPRDPSIASPGWLSTYFDELKVVGERTLAAALESSRIVKPNVEITAKLVEGRPGNEIVTRAKEGDFDLIVMGNRGLSGVRGFFLGSVSNWVADHAECPVLIVK